MSRSRVIQQPLGPRSRSYKPVPGIGRFLLGQTIVKLAGRKKVQQRELLEQIQALTPGAVSELRKMLFKGRAHERQFAVNTVLDRCLGKPSYQVELNGDVNIGLVGLLASLAGVNPDDLQHAAEDAGGLPPSGAPTDPANDLAEPSAAPAEAVFPIPPSRLPPAPLPSLLRPVLPGPMTSSAEAPALVYIAGDEDPESTLKIAIVTGGTLRLRKKPSARASTSVTSCQTIVVQKASGCS